jgi:vitamin B12 transporter
LPVEAEDTAVSATVLDAPLLESLGLPAAADAFRLVPGVSVATTGPRGTQTQLRIRGAEANHSLLFVDGIRFNDPAAGNEARFELLTTDLLSRMEIVRGPQSALWGSEALGGVIAVESADPFRARGFAALGEYGSLDSSRLFGRYALSSDGFGINAAAGWQRGDGIDSFGSDGERDGFETFAANLKAVYHSDPIEIGAAGHWIEGRSEFDGFDPATFQRADTLDETENRIGAIRLWAGADWDGWSARTEGAYLDSANRNRLDDTPLNSTFGDRLTLGAQLSKRFGSHQIIAAIDHQEEDFRARDTAFFGGTDQDRSRSLTALVGEWRADWTDAIATDVAIRHDSFSAFDDATSLRATILVRPARQWTLHLAYGEGIAQPSFYDLFGFFPGSFVGNPELRPEQSREWEAGVRWQDESWHFGVTGFSSRLEDEIVDVFDPSPSCPAPSMQPEGAVATASRPSWATAMPSGSTCRSTTPSSTVTSSVSRVQRSCAKSEGPGTAPTWSRPADPAGSAGAPALPMWASAAIPTSTCSRRRSSSWTTICSPRSTSLSGSFRRSSFTDGSRTASTPIIRMWSATTRPDGRSMRVFASLLAASLALAAPADAAPRRVASLNLCTDELLLALAARSRSSR